MSTDNLTTYYRLKELIYAKYSIPKFALGCEIVARWIAFETKQPCDIEQVQYWCNVTKLEYNWVDDTPNSRYLLSASQAQAITKLFGLTNEYQIFNL